MAAIWFYADPHNQQQGPVEAAWLADAYRSGAVTAQTLVWREGLAGWVPLAQVAAQFGLIVVGGGAAPPPFATASSAAPARIAKPSGSSSSGAIVAVICVVAFFGISILAAIALPAYQDYTIRARVSEGIIVADPVKLAVSEYSEANGRCPHNGDEGFGAATEYSSKYVSRITVSANGSTGECAVEVTYANVAAITGKHLRYTRAHDGSWHVSTDIPPKYLPTSIRNAM
jgi:type IV pilus assembly protein PilA